MSDCGRHGGLGNRSNNQGQDKLARGFRKGMLVYEIVWGRDVSTGINIMSTIVHSDNSLRSIIYYYWPIALMDDTMSTAPSSHIMIVSNTEEIVIRPLISDNRQKLERLKP